MATPSRVDHFLDEAQLAREDALGVVCQLQHILHNAMTGVRAAFDETRKLEDALSGLDGHGDPGDLFQALAALREAPAVRRAAWDGETDRRAVTA